MNGSPAVGGQACAGHDAAPLADGCTQPPQRAFDPRLCRASAVTSMVIIFGRDSMSFICAGQGRCDPER